MGSVTLNLLSYRAELRSILTSGGSPVGRVSSGTRYMYPPLRLLT